MRLPNLSRRELVGFFGVGALASAERTLSGQAGSHPFTETADTPPVQEVVNLQQFEDQARAVLAPDLFDTIAGSDRAPFDLMTFRPRQNVPTTGMDLGIELFSEPLFTPIIAGPLGGLSRYHPEGDLAALRGAAAANALLVVSSRSSLPLEAIAAEGLPFWYGVYGDEPGAGEKAAAATATGARALFITLGSSYDMPGSTAIPSATVDWSSVERIRQAAAGVPVVLKGVTTPETAREAIARGMSGLVVSSHGSRLPGATSPMAVLPSIVAAVEGRVPVLVDGSFRRGTDVLKALILGADAALLGRPIGTGIRPRTSATISASTSRVDGE